MTISFITYYFPPCNSVASNRTQSFYTSLIDAKHHVTVVTRAWNGNENTWNDYTASSKTTTVKKEVDGNGTIYYLPYKASLNITQKLYSKINTGLNFIKGEFNKEVDVTRFYAFCDDLLKQQKFDTILISSPPINSVKLGHLLKKKYPQLKLIIDFRDLQNHILCAKKPTINFKQKVEHYFITAYLKKWLKKASHIVVASDPFQDFFKKIGFEAQLLLNGFEQKNLEQNPTVYSEKFSITVLGTIYPKQEVDFFIQTVVGFIANKSANDVTINLIGVKSIPEVATKLMSAFEPFCNATDKLPRTEALQIGRKSSVLVFSGWREYRGMYSGKLFDYLALKKHILIAPSDNDVVEHIVNTCEAGQCVNTPQEGIDYLNTLYQNWLNKNLVLESNASKILNYSREEQNKTLLSKV